MTLTTYSSGCVSYKSPWITKTSGGESQLLHHNGREVIDRSGSDGVKPNQNPLLGYASQNVKLICEIKIPKSDGDFLAQAFEAGNFWG